MKTKVEQTNKAFENDSTENKTVKTEQIRNSQFIMKPAIFDGNIV